ncbi:MAG TPA: cytochrome c biogenesis protein CcsA [Limnochordales bacterium]
MSRVPIESKGRRHGLFFVTAAAMAVALYLVLVWVPNERTMGVVSRIFYFHVASAWNAFLAFFVVLVASVAYLWRRQMAWDTLAGASAEVGVLFTSIALLTGMFWARPIWNVWWTWDPRLTTTLVLWFLYVGYLVLRSAIPGEERRGRVAAVFGIVAFIDVPIVFLSIRWWRTIHPQVLAPGEIRIAPEMLLTLLVSVAAFTLLYALMCSLAYATGRTRAELDRLKARLRVG